MTSKLNSNSSPKKNNTDNVQKLLPEFSQDHARRLDRLIDPTSEDIVIISTDDDNTESVSYDKIDLFDEKLNEIKILKKDEKQTATLPEGSDMTAEISNSTSTCHLLDNIEPKYKNLVLSGGSIRGISLVGAVKKLVDLNLINLKKLKAVVGTSAGAMLALLIVLGYTIDEIWNIVYFLDMGKMVNPNVLLFLKKCGVETGQLIYDFFENHLLEKTKISNINFQQLYQITNIHLTIVGSCLTTKQAIYYDHINTPNFKVCMALRISIGIPGFFTPIVIGDKKYIDGGVLNNYAMNLFEDRLEETIGVLISNEYSTDYEYPEQYFIAVLNLLLHNYYTMSYKRYKNNTVYVTKSPIKLSPINFNIDNHIKIALFKYGIEAVEEFISPNN